ncbi:hypothetical protein AAC387_Pa10g0666 [Persea americana]
MGKTPVRMKAVGYTLSLFQQKIMSGLWKDLPQKIHQRTNEVVSANSSIDALDSPSKLERLESRLTFAEGGSYAFLLGLAGRFNIL